MKIWKITSAFSTDLVPGDTIISAVSYYLHTHNSDEKLDRNIIQPISCDYVGELLLPLDVEELKKVFLPVAPAALPQEKAGNSPKDLKPLLVVTEPTPEGTKLRALKQAIIDAYCKRGKRVGFSRDLIPFIQDDVKKAYWPKNITKDGLAKAISCVLSQLGTGYKKNSSPRLWEFPV